MFLHDINAEGVENKEALVGVRKAVSLIRYLPPLVRLFLRADDRAIADVE